MNPAYAKLLKRLPGPAYAILVICMLVFILASVEINSLQHRAIPAIAELHVAHHSNGIGIESFIEEYMSDPFARATELTQKELELCKQISALLPAYRSALSWRDFAMRVGFITAAFLVYQHYKLGGARGGRNGPGIPFLQTLARRAATFLVPLLAKLQQRAATAKAQSGGVKDAVVRNIIACPQCKKELRVPSGKGRLRISCPQCGTKFETVT